MSQEITVLSATPSLAHVAPFNQLPTLEDFAIHPMGDRAFLVRLRLPGGVASFKQLDPAARQHCLSIMRSLKQSMEDHSAAITSPPLDSLDLLASYDTLLVLFKDEGHVGVVRHWLHEQIGEQVVQWQGTGLTVPPEGILHRIGISYGGEHGFDLARVAERNGLTPAEVILRHSSTTYTVYVVGFAPGFAYLGNLPPGLDAPRLPQPRPKVPAGSVAIAAGLTAVYPFDMPGGWNIIGYTPFSMFDALQEPPVRLLPGDRVQFYSLQSEGEVSDSDKLIFPRTASKPAEPDCHE